MANCGLPLGFITKQRANSITPKGLFHNVVGCNYQVTLHHNCRATHGGWTLALSHYVLLAPTVADDDFLIRRVETLVAVLKEDGLVWAIDVQILTMHELTVTCTTNVQLQGCTPYEGRERERLLVRHYGVLFSFAAEVT